MTTSEIAKELNCTKLYSRGDDGPIPASQVGERVKNYPQWFDKSGKYILAKKFSPSEGSVVSGRDKPMQKITPNSAGAFNEELAAKVLLNQKNQKAAEDIDSTVPDTSGVYAIRIKDISALPGSFAAELKQRQHNLIYIGIASQSLSKRLGQELRESGHVIFFRSLGAILGFLPPTGSLVNKKNKRNYTFSATDEQNIIFWINANLLVNCVSMSVSLDQFETKLIPEQKPLLNIVKNPYSMPELKVLRARCVDIANQV